MTRRSNVPKLLCSAELPQGKLFSSQTSSLFTTPYPATLCGTTSASTVPSLARDSGRRLHNDGPLFNRLMTLVA